MEDRSQMQQNEPQYQEKKKVDDSALYAQRELSTYEDCLNTCGDVCGCLRAWLPCIFFCVSNPFVEVHQSYVGLVEKFGKYNRTIHPGLQQINPCTDSVQHVDLRTRVVDLDRQVILTKDNISLNIDTVMYFRIIDPVRATYRVQNLTQSVKEMIYSALRQVCGEHILQEILESREKIADSIEQYLDKQTDGWEFLGIFIDEVFIKDMVLTPEMQSDLATAAKNKRIAEAKVISAKADVESAKLMREAADFLDNKAAMQIRFLETLQLIAKGPNPKIMFLPLSAHSTAGTN